MTDAYTEGYYQGTYDALVALDDLIAGYRRRGYICSLPDTLVTDFLKHFDIEPPPGVGGILPKERA